MMLLLSDDLRQQLIAYIRQCPTGAATMEQAFRLIVALQHLDADGEPKREATPTPVTSDADKT